MCNGKCNKDKTDKTSTVSELLPVKGVLGKLVGALGKFLSTKK
jgi:hypothetical protein